MYIFANNAKSVEVLSEFINGTELHNICVFGFKKLVLLDSETNAASCIIYLRVSKVFDNNNIILAKLEEHKSSKIYTDVRS